MDMNMQFSEILVTFFQCTIYNYNMNIKYLKAIHCTCVWEDNSVYLGEKELLILLLIFL